MLMEFDASGPCESIGEVAGECASGRACDGHVGFRWSTVRLYAGGSTNRFATQPDLLFEHSLHAHQLDGQCRVAMWLAHGNHATEVNGARWEIPASGLPTGTCHAFINRSEERHRCMKVVRVAETDPLRCRWHEDVEPASGRHRDSDEPIAQDEFTRHGGK